MLLTHLNFSLHEFHAFLPGAQGISIYGGVTQRLKVIFYNETLATARKPYEQDDLKSNSTGFISFLNWENLETRLDVKSIL